MEEGLTNTSNISQVILDTINNLLSTLFSSIDNSVYDILDRLTFINSDIFNNSYLEKILGFNYNDGLLVIANSLLIAVCAYYGFKLLYSHLSGITVEKPYQFLFKLLIFGIFINSSYYICELFIDFTYIISDSIRGVGATVLNEDISFSALIQNLNSVITVDSTDFNIFSFDGILKSITSISFINLLFTYSLRYIMVKVLMLLTPFAFLTLINNSTSWFFKAWLKIFLSLLFIQPFISIVLLIVFSIDLTDADVFSKILLIGAMYALIRANTYVQSFIGGISTNISQNLKFMKGQIS